ncbi:LysR family transcriptional regulator [Brochothrix thermosphacta]|uniref:LysR family transcriptional regulator n=1 Tax=Brochothrix thermosphacta TaxID=2756 RepID=UPI000EE40A91|nr:LysR family transcriptional regulator [Brochothrix thermosphacta]HCZ39766.1 hypothetical protein [Brochothrix thermosphacta]HCZ45496.1 hypothetical protein [Brochothrix thermosphacta]
MLTYLKAYVAVYELKSFSKAAHFLYCSQPTVSINIKKLEKIKGTTLLNRQDYKNIVATPSGLIVYKRAKKLISDWEIALEEMKKMKSNR